MAHLVKLSVCLLRAAVIGKEVLLADAGLEGGGPADEGLHLPLDPITLNDLDGAHILLDLHHA